MKNTVARWTVAAAALAVAAGSAVAQTYAAEVPLSFRVAGKLMAPGAYELIQTNLMSGQVYRIFNADDGTGAMLAARSRKDVPRAWREIGRPVLAFECAGKVCALRQMWNGRDPFLFTFPAYKLPAGETRTALVTLNTVRGD
jgi:hypothetical protein